VPSLIASLAFAAPGDFDATFGSGVGRVITPIGSEIRTFLVSQCGMTIAP